uniref:Uncharacterized protein n=1 Tax=Varanus komodoensis TaxID=61221 RepID=A0A8D2JG78_VARKO
PWSFARAHGLLDTVHFLLVATLIFHGALFGLLQCTLQGLNSLSRSPKTCSVSGTFSPTNFGSPLRQRPSSASSLVIVSFRILFFSFSFSNFFFHCSAVSSRFTEAVFLIVLLPSSSQHRVEEALQHFRTWDLCVQSKGAAAELPIL